jgi:NAD(P) transhydrogenase subunit alpha
MKESGKYLPRSVIVAISTVVAIIGVALAAHSTTTATLLVSPAVVPSHAPGDVDYWGMVFVFLLSTFVGLGVIRRVSRLLYTPLMSLTNAISAIAVVGAILVAGPDYPIEIRVLGLIALFASVTNIVSGFLITDRMLKMFKKD